MPTQELSSPNYSSVPSPVKLPVSVLGLRYIRALQILANSVDVDSVY